MACSFRAKYNVAEVDEAYAFDLTGCSFIGDPADGTVLFVTEKIGEQLKNLEGCRHCLVFVDEGVSVPPELRRENCLVKCADAQEAYGRYTRKIADREQKTERNRKYTRTPEGYLLGENAVIGEDCWIEPGCMIGHDVVIGRRAEIRTGTVIRNAVIGDDFRCAEYTVIGTEAYFFAGEPKFRIPSFGRVMIGNQVEIGSHAVIERGFNSDTVLMDRVKLDAQVSLGHDDLLEEEVQMTCGATLGGMVRVGRGAYIGMNATVKQRLTIGEGALVGMGASVISNVKAHSSVFGNPARRFGS